MTMDLTQVVHLPMHGEVHLLPDTVAGTAVELRYCIDHLAALGLTTP